MRLALGEVLFRKHWTGMKSDYYEIDSGDGWPWCQCVLGECTLMMCLYID